MNYTITSDEQDKIVKVKMSCTLNQDIRRQVLSAVAATLAMTGFVRVLMDVREAFIDPNEPMVNALAVIEYMQGLGITSRVKFAFLYKDAEGHRKYFEAVSQTEGLNIKYFMGLDDAVEWLKRPSLT